MHLEFSYQQQMVKEVARSFLREKFPREVLARIDEGETGYSPEVWCEMAALGWMGLVFPADYDGAEMGFLELAVLLEEMGRVRPIGPFFSTVVLCGLPLLRAGTEEQKHAFLPALARGETIWALALAEESARYDAAGIGMRASRDGDAYVLNGTKLFVSDAHVADYLLCVARTGDAGASHMPEDGISVFIVDATKPGLRRVPMRALNDDRLCEVVFQDVRVPAGNVLGRFDEGWELVERTMEAAAVAKCCEMVGGARRVLEMTVDYARERKQFGRPIGSFQSIQHHCANMLSDVDSSWLITYEAAWRIHEGLPHSTESAMAKAWVSEAYRRVVKLAHQVHGGVGLIDEHDLPQFFKGASVAELAFGDARFHTKRLSNRLGYR